MKKIFIITISVIVLASCSAPKLTYKKDTYNKLYQEKPVTILALPPINRSTKVEAKELFYSSLIVPLSLKGYYVMPPLLSMEIMKEESVYDAELLLNNSMKRVGEAFGVDAVLFTIIHDWRKTTVLSQINVSIEYILKSTKTDEVLFDRKGNITLNTSVNTGSALGNLVGSMLATALTKEITVGRSCNYYTLNDLPAGKYAPTFGQDAEQTSHPKEFNVTLQNNY
jgi:hypothetical protein